MTNFGGYAVQGCENHFSKTASYCGGSGSAGVNVLPLLEQFWSFNISTFRFLSELLSAAGFSFKSVMLHHVRPAPDPEKLDPACEPPCDLNKDVHHDV